MKTIGRHTIWVVEGYPVYPETGIHGGQPFVLCLDLYTPPVLYETSFLDRDSHVSYGNTEFQNLEGYTGEEWFLPRDLRGATVVS